MIKWLPTLFRRAPSRQATLTWATIEAEEARLRTDDLISRVGRAGRDRMNGEQ